MNQKFKQYPNSLRRYRKAAGLRQHEVARLLGLGTTERLSRWENGVVDPNLENLLHLMVLYRAQPEELFPEKWQAISDQISASKAGVVSVEYIPVAG